MPNFKDFFDDYLPLTREEAMDRFDLQESIREEEMDEHLAARA